MSYSPQKKCFFVHAQEIKFWKYHGKPKYKFPTLLSYWGSKMFALIRGFKIWSQKCVQMISDLYFVNKKKKQNAIKISILVKFYVFLANIWVKYYPNLTLRPYLESSLHGKPFRPLIWKQDWKSVSWVAIVFSKFYLLCSN